jgi:FkbM family methyltransferase
MPATREEHVVYTRNELNNYQYYIDVINELKKHTIKSYLDIGANVGELCNYLFEVLPSLKTAHLIEPENDNFNFMVSNIKEKDIKTYHFAIGYGYKNAKLENHWSGNVGGFLLTESNSGISNVTIKTLEELSLPIVDLVKIDVEGAEYNIIENSKYLQEVEWIEIEFHDYHNKPLVPYVTKYFPNHTIIIVEDIGGRCLLKK